MPPDGTVALFAGAVALGAVHGVEPGHGWPVAATYALNQSSKWLHGLAAGLVIGVGHLVSSIAMVAVFFYAKSYFELTEVNEPITLVSGVQIGGPVSLVAGVLLVALGVREYVHGHGHSHDSGQDGSDGNGHGTSRAGMEGHSHTDHDHSPAGDVQAEHSHEHESGHTHGHESGHTHGHESGHTHGHEAQHTHENDGHEAQHTHENDGHEAQHTHDHEHNAHGHQDSDGSVGIAARLKSVLPFVGGHSHSHSREEWDDRVDAGLVSIAWFAFVLGFAHEEEFEIIALCAGSEFCLELMSVYALTVIVGIVGLTLLLISGYEHFEDEVEQYTPYLPVFSAVVLIVMGLGFITGLF